MTVPLTFIPHRQLLPLVITLIVLGVMAWVGYQIYLSVAKIQTQARKQMGNNVVFTKDGMQVRVKSMENESYLDRTQSWVVKAWELGSSPGANGQDDAAKRKRCVQAYGSRFSRANGEVTESPEKTEAEGEPPR